MSQKDDVPNALRRALAGLNIEKRIVNCVKDFLTDCIDAESISTMFQELRRLYYDDEVQNVEHQNRITSEYTLNSFVYLYLEAIRVSNILTAKKQDHSVWSRGVNKIFLIEGDLFAFGFGNRKKKKNIVVIPVNTRFDTRISWEKDHTQYPLVSEQTVHGAWLRRWEDSGHSLEDLSRSIATQMETSLVKANGAYSYGTIATVEYQKAIYYLLAISEFDSENRAHSSPEIIEQSVVALLKHYDVYGQGCPMYIPLLGTGRSRAELSYFQSYKLISKTMIEHSQHVQGQIYIVATKEAMREIQGEIGGTL